MSKAWSNRFDKCLDPFIEQFNSSINFDKNLIIEDLDCSIAHARMLGINQIISVKESEIIINGLNEIKNEYLKGEFTPCFPSEDIHYCIEEKLISIIGETGLLLKLSNSFPIKLLKYIPA